MTSDITNLLTPRVIKVQELGPQQSTIILEPLERGFGHTLGNALRRILLSSMPGYAITEVMIDGVLHEYSTLEGIQEDVIDILLNLKNVAITLPGKQNEMTLTLDKKGSGLVTAADLVIDQDATVSNPDLVIANLSEKGHLKMSCKVQRGVGYQTSDNRKTFDADEPKKIGVLQLDACFSPVRKVSYAVDHARVEQRTNLDKLIIDPVLLRSVDDL